MRTRHSQESTNSICTQYTQDEGESNISVLDTGHPRLQLCTQAQLDMRLWSAQAPGSALGGQPWR